MRLRSSERAILRAFVCASLPKSVRAFVCVSVGVCVHVLACVFA